MRTPTPNRTQRRRLASLAGLAVLLFASTPVAAAARPGGVRDELGELIGSLVGGWASEHNETPFGNMPFSAVFEWQDDGSLHSRSPLNSETYIDLRFARDEKGRWMLHEEAAMEGQGIQRYSLAPAAGLTDRGLHRWVWEQNPEFLSIDVGVIEETMHLDVILRGRPHVSFRLDRQPEESWPEMKRELVAQGELSPEEGVSIFEAVSQPPILPADAEAGDDDPIALARRAVAQRPDDAEAQLELARRLGAAINDDPANGPRYAFEMLRALTTAVDLDPQLVEAYHYLVGYYLSAPPIAGGSIERAEETAQALAELDPDGATSLLAMIAERRRTDG